MKRVCAWCRRPLDDSPDTEATDRGITHGICETCRDKMLNTMSIPLGRFLDTLPQPVLIVDEDARVLDANESARRATGNGVPFVADRLVGNVFECIHSKEAGGCGRTIHCSGCAIRLAVTRTWRSGEALTRVPATLMIDTDGTPAPVQLYISTEKIGDRVLLRVDEAIAGD